MERSLRTNRTPSRKVVENLEAIVHFQEERKQEKRQADARRKERKRKIEPLDVRDDRLHKQACYQSSLRDQESPTLNQTRLKKQADLQEHLRKQETPSQTQARLNKQGGNSFCILVAAI